MKPVKPATAIIARQKLQPERNVCWLPRTAPATDGIGTVFMSSTSQIAV